MPFLLQEKKTPIPGNLSLSPLFASSLSTQTTFFPTKKGRNFDPGRWLERQEKEQQRPRFRLERQEVDRLEGVDGRQATSPAARRPEQPHGDGHQRQTRLCSRKRRRN